MTYEDIVCNDEVLFCRQQLSDAVRMMAALLPDKIYKVPVERLMACSVDELVQELVEPLVYEPLVLDRDAGGGDHEEFQIPVEKLVDGHLRFGDGRRRRRGGAGVVPGFIVRYRVPFVGHPDLFSFGRNGWSNSLPHGTVQQEVLVLTFLCKELGPHVDAAIQRALDLVQRSINEQRATVDEHNKSVRDRARELLEQRIEQLKKANAAAATMKFPLRRRGDAPMTYVAPEVRRKILPTLAAAPRAATASPVSPPEPIVSEAEYEHILSVMRGMSLVLERSPSAFVALGEEAIRWHFIVQLNGQYEGGATGETFNAAGKTDILVKSGERNIFVAECKFWSGPKGFNDAIDQLLGYLTWRDSKAALVMFNRGVEMSTVLAKIPQALEEHPQRHSAVSRSRETEFRVVLHRVDDHERHITLTVMVFDVPKAPAAE